MFLALATDFEGKMDVTILWIAIGALACSYCKTKWGPARWSSYVLMTMLWPAILGYATYRRIRFGTWY